MRFTVRPFAYLILGLSLLVTVPAFAENDPPPKLLGSVTEEALRQEPFNEWFETEYDAYVPNDGLLAALRSVNCDDAELVVFFGTWCGDSRREVPRMLRLFDEMGFDRSRVRLVALEGDDGMHKRSPGGEEGGMEIYRVPTLVVKRDDREVARLVEHPVASLERDLLAVLRGDDYAPNYASYPIVRGWLDEGLLSDENVSARGLANQLRNLVTTSGELAAAGRVMVDRGQVREGAMVHAINAALHRQDTSAHARLADARLKLGDSAGARDSIERALRWNDDPERLESLLELAGRIECAQSDEDAD